MAVRGDISVNWSASPRVITVAAPSVEVTMQDLLDTLRTLESSANAIDEPFIVDAAGKESLGGGVLVGLTVTLQNAKLAFEARPGPSFVICSVAGGNLVAVDLNGDAFTTPIHPTAFVQVVLTNSSSATLQEQGAIQYASYQNAVWVDAVNGEPGTTFPCGTREHPVDNLADAIIISDDYGFKTLGVIGDLDIVDGDLTGYVIFGQNVLNTHINIGPTAVMTNCHFHHAHITGTLDNNSWLENCEVGDLAYVNGRIVSSAIEGTLTLGGSAGAMLIDCYSTRLAPSEVGVIDMGGAGRNCAVHNFSGHLALRNMTGANDYVALSFQSGYLTIESTVSAGMVHIMGLVNVVDQHTGTANVLTHYVNSPAQISFKVLEEVIASHTTPGTLGQHISDIKAKTDALPTGIRRNQPYAKFPFVMLNATTRQPMTGLTVTAQRMLDYTPFVPTVNTPVEQAYGSYVIDFAAADLNAVNCLFLFTAPGAEPRFVTIITVP